MKKFLLFFIIGICSSAHVIFGQCPQNTGFTYIAGGLTPKMGYEWCTTDGFIFVEKSDPNVFGTFTSTPTGLFEGLAVNTGLINLGMATPNTYQVTFQSRDCPDDSTTETLVIVAPLELPDLSIDYGAEVYCEDHPENITPQISGPTNGIFSVDKSGLMINATTGEIDIMNSQPDSYTVSYSVDFTDPCNGGDTTIEATDTVIVLSNQEVDFSYTASTFCKDDLDPAPTFSDPGVSPLDGVFSYSVPMVNGNTGSEELRFSDISFGIIDLAASDPGTYDITITMNGTVPCQEMSHTERIEIAEAIDTSFRLTVDDATEFCGLPGDTDPVPFDFTTGGTFSASPSVGLSIDPSTGVIDVTASQAGVYDITYDFSSASCGGIYTLNNVRIKIPNPTTNPVQEFCANTNPTVGDLSASTVSGYQIRWYDSPMGTTVLNNVNEGDPFPPLTTGTYYVATYSSGCDAETDRIAVAVRVYGSSYPLIAEASVDGSVFNTTPTAITLTEGQALSLGLGTNFTGDVSWSGPNSFSATGVTATISNSLVVADSGTYTATVDFPSCSVSASIDFELTVQATTVLVSPQVYLQGAMLGTTDGLMRDDLRTLGYLPTTSPYTDGITVASTVFEDKLNPAEDIVDWVWVELRDAADNTSVIEGQSALLQRDGTIIDTQSQPLAFATSNGNYYLVINHRNHLGIMSKDPISLSSTATIVNFTTSAGTETFGTEAQTSFGMPSGTLGMWAGDANGDGRLTFSGGSSDGLDILVGIVTAPGNTSFLNNYTLFSGYLNGDVNMDGTQLYSGSQSDRLRLFINIVSHPLNTSNLSNFELIVENVPN